MPTRTQAATAGLLVPATLSLFMSADTSYRFLGTALAITESVERAALCGVAEAAIIALTVYSWATRSKGAAYLAYAAVLVQGIPAFYVSGQVGGPVRVVLGPVLLAVLLHLLLGLELRMSGEKSNGLFASVLRELRERLTAFLGIGRRGADSAAIARSRAADRAVDLADRVAAAKPGGRRHSRLSARLAEAIDAARHGLSPADAADAEALIVARVVRRKSVRSLAEIKARHDWATSLVSRDKGQDDVPVPRVPQDVPGDKGQAPVSPVPAVSPEPVPVVPPVVSRTQASVPAVSPARPAVRAKVSPAPEDVPADRDVVSPAVSPERDMKADVPGDVLENLTGVVRFLRETGHTEDEIRAIVPTLPGHEETATTKRDSLKKAIQRTRPKAA